MGGFYNVRTADGTLFCKPRGIFRKEKTVIVVGDRVRVEPLPDGTGVITELLPRKNFFLRPPLANLDQMFIILAAANPAPDPMFADKLAVVCEQNDIAPVIVVNKSDLCSQRELLDAYRKAGYATIEASAKTGAGTDDILRCAQGCGPRGCGAQGCGALSGSPQGCGAQGCVSAFSGFSGAGKSSLLSLLLPQQLKTGSVNEKLGRGRHTTRHTELFEVAPGAFIADTAGFSSFDILQNTTLRKEDLQEAFPEFRPFLGQCRWNACTHLPKERDCAVRAAVERGEIAPTRYADYCAMYEQLKARPDWK